MVLAVIQSKNVSLNKLNGNDKSNVSVAELVNGSRLTEAP